MNISLTRFISPFMNRKSLPVSRWVAGTKPAAPEEGEEEEEDGVITWDE